MQNEYMILKESTNSYNRCKSLITIYREEFGEESLFLCTSIDTTKEEILKCFNKIFEYIAWINHIPQSEQSYKFYRMSCFTNTDDDFYKNLIDFGGFNQVLMQGNDILEASIILLNNSTEEHLIECFSIENEKQALDIIEESIDAIKDSYLITDNDEINNIINDFWMNTIDFDYGDFGDLNEM